MRISPFYFFLQYVVFVSAALVINTPLDVIECSNTSITWTDGTAPYVLSLLSAGATTDATGSRVIASIAAMSYLWTVDEPNGNQFILQVKDSTGALAETSSFEILVGNTSCISSQGNTSGSGTQTQSLTATSGSSTSASSTNSGGNVVTEVVIIVIVAVVAISLVFAVLYIWRRRRRNRKFQMWREDALHSQPLTQSADMMPPNLSNNSMVTAPSSTALDYYSQTPVPFMVPLPVPAKPDLEDAAPPAPIAPIRSIPQRSITISPPPQPYSPPPLSIATTAAPPAYQMLGSPSNSSVPPLPIVGSLANDEYRSNDDEIRKYAAANRDIIPHELEEKLRRARYMPTDDPEEIPADFWLTQYGVGHFELKRLQELFERNHRRNEKARAHNNRVESPERTIGTSL